MHVPDSRSLSSAGLGRSGVETAVREPYFLGLNRAMVSLGPLTGSAYCTFKCKFCYVNGPYPKYAKRTVDDILDWLRSTRDQYDIVYVSGDTDSFAAPRTEEGIRLLGELSSLNIDVLFTTRYVFTHHERLRLASLFAEYAKAGKLLIPCVSVSQLTHPRLEPPPIPSPTARLKQIQWFYEQGAPVLLTVRPFIPYVKAQEYAEIVRLGAPHSAAVLGGDWYTDLDGVIDRLTREALGISSGRLLRDSVSRRPLDSTNDAGEWLIARHPEAETLSRSAAHAASKNFYLRSADAIRYLRTANDR